MAARRTQSAPDMSGSALAAAEQDGEKGPLGEFASLNRISTIGVAVGFVGLLTSVAGYYATGIATLIIVGVCFGIAGMLTFIMCGVIVIWKIGRELLMLRRYPKSREAGAKAET